MSIINKEHLEKYELMMDNYELAHYKNLSVGNTSISSFLTDFPTKFHALSYVFSTNKDESTLNSIFSYFVWSHRNRSVHYHHNFNAEFICEIDTVLKSHYLLKVHNDTTLNVNLLDFSSSAFDENMYANVELLLILKFYVQQFCVKQLADFFAHVTFGQDGYRPPVVSITKRGSNITCSAQLYSPLGLSIQWKLENKMVPDDLTEEYLASDILKGKKFYFFFKSINTESANYQCVVIHQKCNYSFNVLEFNNSDEYFQNLFHKTYKHGNYFEVFWILLIIPILAFIFSIITVKKMFFEIWLHVMAVLNKRKDLDRSDSVKVIMEIDPCDYISVENLCATEKMEISDSECLSKDSPDLQIHGTLDFMCH